MILSHSNLRHPRASVLILVIAVLALLAILATVYITVSRTEVQSARMTASAMNLDLARDSVINQIQTLLYAGTTDCQGVIGGLTAKPASNGKTSRYYDYPETGSSPGQTDANPDCPDEPWLARSPYPTTPTDISQLTTLSISPATNLPTLSSQLATINAVGDPNHPDPDSPANLLSYSSANGERYRFGVRILDLSAMANLNTAAAQIVSDPQGQYLSSYSLGNFPALNTARKNSSSTPFSLDDWQSQILSIEKTPDPLIAFFDSTDELELRSYADHGTPYICRPAYILSQLRGPNPARSNYTTYSFSRDLRLRPDPALPPPSTQPASTAPATQPVGPPSPPYTLAPSDNNPFPIDCGKYIWPLLPEKIWISPKLDLTSDQTRMDALFYHARAGTNIATAMELAGFSTDESRAFAINYLSFRWNGLLPDPNISAPAYYYPAGPTFLDDQGICLRVSDASAAITARDFAGSSDLRAILPTEDPAHHQSKIYLAFLPQPFINKVAAQLALDPTTNNLLITDVAVELCNPYPVALSLRGFKLKSASQETPLDNLYIPANGFLTITEQSAGPLTAKINSNGQSSSNPNLILDPLAGKITLTRPYIPRGKTKSTDAADAPIDQYPYDTLLAPAGITTTAKIYYLRRSNDPAGKPNWQSAIHSSTASTRFTDASTPLTLNTLNPNDTPATTPTLVLIDRYTQTPTLAQAAPFTNFADFNQIPRICNQFPDSAAAPASTFSINLLPAQLAKIMAAAPPPETAQTDFPAEAQLHFDFKATPAFFLSPSTIAPAATIKPGDPRAVRLFDYLALLDRVPDRSIDIGSGPTSIDKLRIPGRININTAPRAVLLGLPNLTPTQADAILAYRDRTTPYNAPSQFPGKAIRTLTELMIPLAQSQTTSPTNLNDRDKPWASIINLCTTRSDTFVLYGYLESIRPNPNTTHNNADDWYNVPSTTNDPHNLTAKNIRTARIRFIAILDRSLCNYSRGSPQFTLPKIIAIKNLPN